MVQRDLGHKQHNQVHGELEISQGAKLSENKHCWYKKNLVC